MIQLPFWGMAVGAQESMNYGGIMKSWGDKVDSYQSSRWRMVWLHVSIQLAYFEQ